MSPKTLSRQDAATD